MYLIDKLRKKKIGGGVVRAVAPPASVKPKTTFTILQQREKGPGVPQGDIVPKQLRGQKVDPAELGELRELMRRRYALDMEIWSMRDDPEADRPIAEEKMKETDAIYTKIRALLNNMDDKDLFENEQHYLKFVQIKSRLLKSGKRVWCKQPPWTK
jgi:hypothetical protein